MSQSIFYNLDELEKLAVNIFYGMGYNFYRAENQLRQDDQIARARVSSSLGASRKVLEDVQSRYRQKFLPPPTREKPSPDPEAVAAARMLEELSGRIGKLEGLIRTLPVPGNDRMTQRYRQEAETLRDLGVCDTRLVGQAETLRIWLDGKEYAWLLENEPAIVAALSEMGQQVRTRQMLLQ